MLLLEVSANLRAGCGIAAFESWASVAFSAFSAITCLAISRITPISALIASNRSDNVGVAGAAAIVAAQAANSRPNANARRIGTRRIDTDALTCIGCVERVAIVDCGRGCVVIVDWQQKPRCKHNTHGRKQ